MTQRTTVRLRYAHRLIDAPQYWWHVVVYESQEDLGRAAVRFGRDQSLGDALAVCQSSVHYTQTTYAGVLRFTLGAGVEPPIIAHECLHAVLGVYRRHVSKRGYVPAIYARSQRGLEEAGAEEALCHLHTDLMFELSARMRALGIPH